MGFTASGVDNFVLLIDDDGIDFSDATIVATGVFSFGNVIFTGIDLEHEDYFTLAVIDNIIPTVTLEQAASQSDPAFVNSNVFFTVTFSEPIDSTTFTCSDIVVAGTATAACTGITEISPFDQTTFEVSFVAADIGTIIANIPASAVTDIVGNENVASTSLDNVVTIVPSIIITNRKITYRVKKN